MFYSNYGSISCRFGIKFTHRPKISIFAPQGRLVASIHVKFSMTNTWVRLATRNFMSIGSRVNAAPKVENFHFLAKSSPAWANPLTISTILGAFIRPTALRKCFKFDVILLRRYGVIAEKLLVCHLARNFPCTL